MRDRNGTEMYQLMIIKYYKYYNFIKFLLQMVLELESMLVCIHTY